MRASRLLSIMMMLQAKGRMSAETLAEELEVSVRTVYRDIDQLSASGVPVYAETGRNGGFQLLDGWRTRLTGLTPPEAQALFLSGLPGPASQLGLGEAMASAELKLLAALPADWQVEAQRISSRFHLDPSGWFQRAGATGWLKPVADAVWSEHSLDMRYESWNGVVERRVDPFGLVLKSGLWYLVARGFSRSADGEVMRTYRLDNILSLTASDATFQRPADFDLAAYWTDSTASFEREIYVGTAEVRVTRRGLKRLTEMPEMVARAALAAEESFDEDGWMRLSIPIEETSYARREMMKVGPDLEVLSPKELRDAMTDIAQRMATLYRLAAVD